MQTYPDANQTVMISDTMPFSVGPFVGAAITRRRLFQESEASS